MEIKVDIKVLSDEVKKLIDEKNIQKLRELSKNYYPADISEAIKEFDPKLVIIFLRLLETDISSELFTFLDAELQEHIIEVFSSKEVKELFEGIYTDDVVDIIDEMPSNIVRKVLRVTSKETRLLVNEILQYEEHTAGGIMSVDFVKLKVNSSIKEAVEKIRNIQRKTEKAEVFFVVDEFNNLKGYVTLNDLFFSDQLKLVKDIYKTKIVSSATSIDQEEVVDMFKKYDISILPVVNKQDKLVGIITFDDVIDVQEEEATEDIHKMAGISPTEDSYFKTSVWKMVKARTFWLLFLMISATASQLVVTAFMKVYKVGETGVNSNDINITYVVTILLTPLLTVISGTSGNAGSQSSTMVVRALSLNEVTTKDLARVLWKELRVASITGLILVAVNFVRMVIIYSIEAKGDINHSQYWFSIATVSIAMYITLIVSKLIGGTLPILAKKVRLDPAVMAAPLLTTLVDAMSTAVFFSIGLIFFGDLIQ